MDGGYYPTKLIDKLNKDHELFKSIGEEAAQRIYEEEISRIEKLTGQKFPRWDSDKNTPVVGTPEAYYGSKKHLEHLEEVNILINY